MTEVQSQPLETLGVRPTLDELKSDWSELEERAASRERDFAQPAGVRPSELALLADYLLGLS